MSQPFTKSFKHSLPKTSNEQHSSKAKSLCHNVTESSSLKTDVLCNSAHKVRRLKTRKERNQIRGQERNRSQPCPQKSRKEVGEKAQRHHIHPMSGSRNERPFAKPFILQKPSIITEGRLTSIKGLFSNEVRSLDIERLVSEQIKQDNQKKEPRKQSMVQIRSQLPTLVPDSDQDCILNDVPGPENNSTPQVKRKISRKELTGKRGFQTNRKLDASVPLASSSVDGKHKRNTRTEMEGNNSKTKQNSAKEPEQVILSSSENEPIPQLCSTPIETNKHNFNISQTSTLKTPDDGKHIQRFEEISTIVEFPNMEDLQPLTSLSGLSSGTGQLANNDKQQEEEMSVSCREEVKRLAKRLCSASDLYVPSYQRSLLDKCKKTLMQTLQKRHSFQLNHNLHRLRSSLNGKQKASQPSTEQTCEDRSPFSHAVEIEDRCNISNMPIWTDRAVRQDFLPDQVPRHQDRGMSTKKRKVQEWKISSPQFFLKEPQQSPVDMFDQWRPATLSQDSFRPHQHPIGQLFNQDQTFTQHAAPILKAPTWEDHLVNPHCQQQFRSRGESWTNVDLDLSKISQQFREDTDVNIDSYQFYDSRKQRPEEASFGGSSFWSHQSQTQDERKKTAPFSFSASYLTEGFQYEPFFRCPHPSNTQRRSEYPNMTFCPRSQSNTLFYPHLFL